MFQEDIFLGRNICQVLPVDRESISCYRSHTLKYNTKIKDSKLYYRYISQDIAISPDGNCQEEILSVFYPPHICSDNLFSEDIYRDICP